MLAGLATAPVAALPSVAADVSAAPDAEEQLMTAEDYAAFEFEPLPADLLALCEPPNNDKWTEISLHHLIFIRLAWVMLRQTKDETINGLRNLEDEAGNVLFDGFTAAIKFHKQAVDILEAAEARILVAGSFLEVNEWEALA
jgi:hypothetical protein